MKKPLSEMSLEELWQLFPIFLTEPQDEWDTWYDEEAKMLQQVLAQKGIKRISHIGSTAIKGIWAKPTIDILVEMLPHGDMKEIKEILIRNGYTCMSEDEKRISFNKGYTENGFAERVFHLHLRDMGDHDELYFRDCLNTNPTVAKQYEKLKLSLWKKYEHDRDGYTAAKGEFVRKFTQKAKVVLGNKYESLD